MQASATEGSPLDACIACLSVLSCNVSWAPRHPGRAWSAGVINRSQQDIITRRNIRDARAAEAAFFEAHPEYQEVGLPPLAALLLSAGPANRATCICLQGSLYPPSGLSWASCCSPDGWHCFPSCLAACHHHTMMSSAALQVAAQCGVMRLASSLNVILVEHIRLMLPQLRSAIDEALEKRLAELRLYGDPLVGSASTSRWVPTCLPLRACPSDSG